MSDVFISYAKEDIESARMIADALQKAGFSLWWDRHIPPGKTWDEVIGQALDDAACMIVLWSNASVSSRWVREEAERGASRGRLIPALIAEVEPPLGFGRIQAANLSRWRGDERAAEFVELLAAVAALVKANSGKPAAATLSAEATKPVTGGLDASSKPGPSTRRGKGRAILVASALAVVGLAAAGYLTLKQFAAPKPQILHFAAVPALVEQDQPVTLSWRTRNASEVSLEDVGQVEATGGRELRPVASRSYTLVAGNERGQDIRSGVQVTVVPAKPQILSFKATPDSIERGGAVTLSWQTRNASQVELEGFGPVEAEGKRKLSPGVGRKYTLTASNQHGGEDRSSVEVLVKAPAQDSAPRILSFKATPDSVERGKAVMLSWQTEGAVQVTIEGIGKVEGTGQRQVNPSKSQKFTLIATGEHRRTAQGSVEVVVKSAPPPEDNWVQLEHDGAYTARFRLRWPGIAPWDSGERSRGYRAKVPIPPGVETVIINAEHKCGIKGWERIFRAENLPTRRTYTVYGSSSALTCRRPPWRVTPPLQ